MSGTGDNARYVVRNLWKWDRGLLLTNLLRVPIDVLGPFLGIWIAREVVAAVTEGLRLGAFWGRALPVALLLVLCAYGRARIAAAVWWSADAIQNRYKSLVNRKRMTMDYENLLSKRGQTLLQRANAATNYWGAAANQGFLTLMQMLSGALGFLLYGGAIAFASPWIVCALLATTVANYFLLKHSRAYEFKARDSYAPLDKKLDYLSGRASDIQNAKDIRLYGMGAWFKETYRFIEGQRLDWYKKTTLRAFFAKLGDAGLLLLRDGAGYAILIFMAARGEISAADFVFTVSAVAGFSKFLTAFITNASEFQTKMLDMSDLRAFLDLPDAPRGDDEAPLDLCDLTLEHVSYRYPDSEAYALRDVSLTLRAGEKLALVGVNGAGKTTLASILCGLLAPSEGRVLLGGRDIRSFSRESYARLFSAVFQNIAFLPLSIWENVAGGPGDRARALDCLEKAGLSETLMRLSEGADAKLVRAARADATELSGGEAQKLALARALYKDAPILLLDEPTAALDPIAEGEIYEQYASLTKGKSSLFISHRLASTRFCDRVALLEDGRVRQLGTHESLLSEDGPYRELFETQSRYYRRETLEKEAF